MNAPPVKTTTSVLHAMTDFELSNKVAEEEPVATHFPEADRDKFVGKTIDDPGYLMKVLVRQLLRKRNLGINRHITVNSAGANVDLQTNASSVEFHVSPLTPNIVQGNAKIAHVTEIPIAAAASCV